MIDFLMRSRGIKVYQLTQMQNLAKTHNYHTLYFSDSKDSMKPKPDKHIGSLKD